VWRPFVIESGVAHTEGAIDEISTGTADSERPARLR
jgi:hypothetical protein